MTSCNYHNLDLCKQLKHLILISMRQEAIQNYWNSLVTSNFEIQTPLLHRIPLNTSASMESAIIYNFVGDQALTALDFQIY